MLDRVLSNKVRVDERRAGAGNYCYRLMSLRDKIDQVSGLLPPNITIPSEIYLSLKFATNSNRVVVNYIYYKRVNVKRKCQSHALVKENKDTHYDNAQATLVRNRMTKE